MSKWMYLFLQGIRYRAYLELLDPQAQTLLDLGSEDGRFARLAESRGYSARSTDIENAIETTRDSADIVTCFQVLEHTRDPVAALKNLSKTYQRQLIVSVPNEPWFSLWRLSWDKEHWWAISPEALRFYLGEPSLEKVLVLGRYYVGVWNRR